MTEVTCRLQAQCEDVFSKEASYGDRRSSDGASLVAPKCLRGAKRHSNADALAPARPLARRKTEGGQQVKWEVVRQLEVAEKGLQIRQRSERASGTDLLRKTLGPPS